MNTEIKGVSLKRYAADAVVEVTAVIMPDGQLFFHRGEDKDTLDILEYWKGQREDGFNWSGCQAGIVKMRMPKKEFDKIQGVN